MHRKLVPVFGAYFWYMCHGHKRFRNLFRAFSAFFIAVLVSLASVFVVWKYYCTRPLLRVINGSLKLCISIVLYCHF